MDIVVIVNVDCDQQFGAMVVWDVFYHDGEETWMRSKGCQQEWRRVRMVGRPRSPVQWRA